MSFEFVDGNGTRWMVLPGSPADLGQLLRRMSKLPTLTSEHWAQLLQKAVPWPSLEPGFRRL